MSSPLQFVPDFAKKWLDSKGRAIAIAEVTVRTLMGMFLLKPTPQNTDLILGVLGRAQALFDFELYMYAFLSNHGSYLIGVRSAEHLSQIKCYVHGNIAVELGKRPDYKWDGKFYGRPGRSIVVLTDEAVLDRMRYICANGTKEDLVTEPRRWPGAHAAQALCSGSNDTGTWIDRTESSQIARKHTDKRRKPTVVQKTYTVKLSKIPPLAHLSDEDYAEYIKAMCNDISADAAEERKRTGKTVLGVKAIMRFSPMHIPKDQTLAPAPRVHCHDPAMRRAFIADYRAFEEAYRLANLALRQGLEGFEFPEGGHPPVSCRMCQAG